VRYLGYRICQLVSLERDQVKWKPVNRPIARQTVKHGHDHESKINDHALSDIKRLRNRYWIQDEETDFDIRIAGDDAAADASRSSTMLRKQWRH